MHYSLGLNVPLKPVSLIRVAEKMESDPKWKKSFMDAYTGQTKDPLTQYQSSLVASSILKKYMLQGLCKVEVIHL